MPSKYNFPDHSSSRRKYDVFLSFRGKDTRQVFANNLYETLKAKGLYVFRDDDEIEGGKKVNPELMKAIEESTYSVIIISVNYADSSWCLNELVKILKCSKNPGETVFPIFYHVDPSDVRKQRGKFGDGFSDAVSKNRKNSQRWKKALTEIGNIKGGEYPSQGYKTEADFREELALKILFKLKNTYPDSLKGLVGMKSRMERLINLLDLESTEARMVGIWGLKGSGKKTVAKAVFDSICWQFEGCSIIEKVSEVVESSGFSAIKKKIIFDILKVKDMSGTNLLWHRVCNKKVLIVLEDVAEKIELDSLFGDPPKFSCGSRIIITTENKQCLIALKAHVYEVQRLDYCESKELLISSTAFPRNGKTEKFLPHIDHAVKYADGFPSALKALGSLLSKKNPKQWEDELERLNKSPNDKDQEILRASYKGLKNSNDKNLFLDICCFFRGKYKDEVINLHDSCGVENLVNKSLLKIKENNTVWLLSLVQKMGRTIVLEESEIPGERSRLWHHDDIKRVLMENTGTNKIKGICDNDPETGAKELELDPQAFKEMTNLKILKINYTIRKSKRPTIKLPNTLRYLDWQNYNLNCMPPTFRPKDIVELHLANSSIKQLWDGMMELPKLTILDLRYSTSLIKSPDFTGLSNLRKLILEGCTKLANLHPSLKDLKKLTILNLRGCEILKTIPRGFESRHLEVLVFSGCLNLGEVLENFGELKKLLELYLDGTGITEVPKSIGDSTSLCYLDLSHCKNLKRIPCSIGKLKKLKMLVLKGCSSLHNLPEEVGHIESLEILDVSHSGVRKLPSSALGLRNLQVLSLRECNGYPFPSCMYSFLSIFLPTWTSNCMTLVIPSFSTFESLTSLDLAFCRLKSVSESISCCSSLREIILTKNKFESLPESMKDLTYLEKLWLRKCKNLKEIPELPSTVRYVMASGCESLKTICSPSLLEDALLLCFSNCSQLVDNEEINTLMDYKFLLNQIKLNDKVDFRVYTGPGSKIPDWFTNRNVGASINFELPSSHEKSSNLLGLALSIVVANKGKDCKIGVQIKAEKTIVVDRWAFLFYANFQDVYILYFPWEMFSVNGSYPGGIEFQVRFGKAEYDSNVWKSMVDKVGDPATEVNRCGARLIYEDELEIIKDYIETPNEESGRVNTSGSLKKFKICLFLFILYVLYYILYN